MRVEHVEVTENTQRIVQLLNQQQTAHSDDFQKLVDRQFSIGTFQGETWVGGAVANLFGNTLHLSLLGVAAAFRHTGIGTKLVQTIQQLALEQHCRYITVNTQDYQALNFYRGLGFQVFASLPDTPFVGTEKFYLQQRVGETTPSEPTLAQVLVKLLRISVAGYATTWQTELGPDQRLHLFASETKVALNLLAALGDTGVSFRLSYVESADESPADLIVTAVEPIEIEVTHIPAEVLAFRQLS